MNKPLPARNIGSYVPMIDGPEKVSGRARYTADIVQPGQLAGRIYRSPYSHAEIIGVDVSEALNVPGVISIVTGDDCDRGFGVLPIARTEYPLARGDVGTEQGFAEARITVEHGELAERDTPRPEPAHSLRLDIGEDVGETEHADAGC
ncbi:MAG TPA: hypothetical protein VJR71_15070 [Pseudolabrys sp.]|nr:hypothetical protein [Pseudolabrys sp.]